MALRLASSRGAAGSTRPPLTTTLAVEGRAGTSGTTASTGRGRRAGTTSSGGRTRVAHGLRSTAAATPALNSNDLVVHGAHFQADVGPGGEVVGNSHGSAGSGRLTDRDVLVEGGSSDNGRFVDTRVLVDGVGGTIAGKRALDSALRRWVVVVFLDVVFHEGIFSPAVHTQKTSAARGVELAAEVDGTRQR